MRRCESSATASTASSRRRGTWRAIVVALVLSLFGGAGAASAEAANLTGTWHCCGGGGAAPQDYFITDSGGGLSGEAQIPGGQVFATISGSVGGSQVTIVTTYNSFSAGYVATLIGTLSEDGNTITGTWTSNRGQSGTFTATREATESTISGRVLETTCGEKSCKRKGLAGVTIRATGGPDGPGAATTGKDGRYELKLKDGTWTVTPRMAGRSFEKPSEVVALDGSASDVDFQTCSEQSSSSRDVRELKDSEPTKCKRIDLQATRIFGPGGWSQKSGKSYLGKAQDIRVGWTVPAKNGDFVRRCVSGCVNIRLRLTDSETHKFIPTVRVTLEAKVGGKPITRFSRDGVFCPADGTPSLADKCTPKFSFLLDHKRDLDVYYWMPGVIDPTKIEITATATAASYPKAAKENVTVTATPNVAFHKQVKLSGSAIFNLNALAPIVFGIGLTDVADYCSAAAKALTNLANDNVPAGLRNATVKLAQKLSKLAKSGCSFVEIPAIITKAKGVVGWLLYWDFQSRLGIPPSGLVGHPRLINWGAQILLEYSGFYDAFLNSLKGFLYADYDWSDPNANKLHTSDRMKFTIYEVSYRGESSRLGSVNDALFVRMGGTRGAAADGSGGVAITPYEEYLTGGYWPGCWLDPSLNHEEFWFPIGTNPCNVGDV